MVGRFQTLPSGQFLNPLLVPIHIYGHEWFIMTERVLFQVQAEELRFFRSDHHMTLHDKLRSWEIRKAMNFEPLFFQIEWF